MQQGNSGLLALPPIRWASRHPRVAAWIALSVGMVVLLIFSAREIGLLPLQWVALVAACVLVAGACIWIVSWEDRDEQEPEAVSDKDASK